MASLRGFDGLLGLAILVASSDPTWAFECSRVPECEPNDFACQEPAVPRLTQAWNQRCLPFSISRGDDIFTGETMEEMVIASFARWSNDLPCTDLETRFVGYTDDGLGFDARNPNDQTNVILSTRNPSDLGAAGPEVLALTLTSFSKVTGEIFDSDIVFNLVSTTFETIPENDPSCLRQPIPARPFDIENTLVHEIGHFMGFDHVSSTVATMFAMAEGCETLKRTLEQDDIDAICTTYAAGQPTQTCQPPSSYDQGPGDPSEFRDQCNRSDDCGCQSVPRAPKPLGWIPALLFTACVLSLIRWRTRHRKELANLDLTTGSGRRAGRSAL